MVFNATVFFLLQVGQKKTINFLKSRLVGSKRGFLVVIILIRLKNLHYLKCLQEGIHFALFQHKTPFLAPGGTISRVYPRNYQEQGVYCLYRMAVVRCLYSDACTQMLYYSDAVLLRCLYSDAVLL
jgi:hypothetical protein